MAMILNPPPQTPFEPVTDMLHDISVTDPYRWLEDQHSSRTREWLAEQTSYARSNLDAIPYRASIQERVTELLSISPVAEPWNVGDRYFFLKRQENKEQPAIVMRNGLFGDDTILVDPSSREGGKSVAVAIRAIAHDGRFLAYSVRRGGTDHFALEILDIEQNTLLSDRLPEGWCTGIAFSQDGSGFYYSHIEVRDPRPNYRAVFWHRFGTLRSADEEVFCAQEQPNLFIDILQSTEANLLAYAVSSTGKERNCSIYLQTMSPADVPRLLLHLADCNVIPFFAGNQLLALTDFGAPNFRIVSIDAADSEPVRWRDVVPESDRRIQQFSVVREKIFVTRIDRFSTRMEAFGNDGKRSEDIRFPQYGTISLLNPTCTSNKLFYSYTSASKPTTVYCYDTRSEVVCVWDETNVPFDPSMIAVEEVAYTSKDGSSIPLLLTARKDRLHSGPLPTFLTGYGGFGICVTPRFTAFATFLIEQGFLFAVPALRGGSELGEEWHLQGKRQKRQNSFDDFIAAAEWLISQGRSLPGHLAIGGGSNAGLLVGAMITQRPDLFRAAICLGPLLDMARYHLFDFAGSTTDEYGSPEDEEDFRSLLSYSPYHRVQNAVAYPAVLLISGDADSRCNPMHARKMTARLQAASNSGYPILLDYRPDWGHMPVQPLSIRVAALTDRLAFVCHELGIDVQPRSSS